MRLLELCLAPAFGGLEIHVSDFSTWIVRKRPEVDLVLAVGNGTQLDRRLSPLGRPMLRFARRRSLIPFGNLLLGARRLARFVKDNRVDVVHIHHKSDLPLVALAKAMNGGSFALVHSRHMDLYGKKTDPYHRFLYGQLDRYIVVTAALKRQATDKLHIDADRIVLVYNGSEEPRTISDKEKAALRRELGVGDGFVVGLVGRIEQFKGQHILIDAIEKLRGEGLDASAVIVGGCMDTDYLDDIKRRVEERGLPVVFRGFHDNIPELMQCFDVSVLTTKLETFGLVLVEAMLAGVPAVGSDAGGVPEIIDDGETGLLYDSFDADSLAERLGRLYRDDKLRERLALAGREKARRQFDRDTQFGKLLGKLQELSHQA